MSGEGEAEVSIVDLPATDVVPEAEGDVTPDAPTEVVETQLAAPAKVATVDALLQGQLPDDVKFYQQQALEGTEPEFSAEDIEALGTRGKMLLATLLARAEKAKGEVSTFQGEVDKQVAAATDTLKAAQQERAAALDWTKGKNVAAQREQVQQVLSDRTPLDPQDPNYLQRIIDRAVAARMGEFFQSIDEDATQREQAVKQTELDGKYNAYRTTYEQFSTAHKDELVVAGQKETVTRWSGEYDQSGQPVMKQYVIEKRTPLAQRIEDVMNRYGADPNDSRMYRMPFDQAYALALHELSSELDASEHEASMQRARERVVRPTARQPPPPKPPVGDSNAFAEFLAKNPDWVAEQNRRHFGE